MSEVIIEIKCKAAGKEELEYAEKIMKVEKLMMNGISYEEAMRQVYGN